MDNDCENIKHADSNHGVSLDFVIEPEHLTARPYLRPAQCHSCATGYAFLTFDKSNARWVWTIHSLEPKARSGVSLLVLEHTVLPDDMRSF